MPTIGTAYAAVLVINLNGLLASGAFVGHLLLYLKGLLERPKHRAPQRGLRDKGPAGKSITAFAAAPYGRARPCYSIPSARRAIVRSLGLLLHIGHELSRLAAVPRTKTGC